MCGCGAGAVVVAVSSATGRGGKNGWLPDDLNNGRLDLFFLFLAGQHPQALTHPMCCPVAVYTFATACCAAFPRFPTCDVTMSGILHTPCNVVCDLFASAYLACYCFFAAVMVLEKVVSSAFQTGGALLSAGLMVLNLVWFLWVVRSFEYKAVEHPSMRTAPATTYKPPAWAQAQVVSGVQPANVSFTFRTSLVYGLM